METSILTSVKKLLGIAEDYTEFDVDIVLHINTVFMTLSQLGIGPEGGFFINDKNSTWDTYTSNKEYSEAVKSYIALKVRLLFDPPQNSNMSTVIEKQIQELEWRLLTSKETGGE